MQHLNQRLANQPLLDFFNATLRGIGQVIFVNNPVSGLLILIAIFIQSPRLGTMSLLGTAAANRECDRTPAKDKLMYLNARPTVAMRNLL